MAREARVAHNHILQGDGGLTCPACILVRPEVMGKRAISILRHPAMGGFFGSPRQPGSTVLHDHTMDDPCNDGCTIIPVT